jgi:hypothetical protein
MSNSTPYASSPLLRSSSASHGSVAISTSARRTVVRVDRTV